MARPLTAPKGAFWSDEDLEFVRGTLELPVKEVSAALGRTRQSIEQARTRIKHGRASLETAVPVVKAPGDYLETLSSYFAGQFDLMEIWCRWNGYSHYRLLCETNHGIFGSSTLICTAKG